MTTPSWILDILAGLMLVVAAVSAARLVVARVSGQADRDADINVAHLLMGIAMAGMLTASLTTLPNDAWDVIFAALTALFGWRVYRESRVERARVLADGHHMPHLVHSAAMLYMFVAISGPAAGGGGMSGMGGSGSAMQTLNAPVVAFIFALWLLGYVVLDLDRLSGPGHGHGSYFTGPAVQPATAALIGAAASSGSVNLAAASAPTVTPAAGGVATATAEPAAGGQPPGAGDGGAGTGAGAARTILLGPKVAAGCRIAMGVTMAFMLLIMI